MFTLSFSKTAGLKHWATAAMIAASPVKAHAHDMASTVGKALETTARSTQTGRNVEHNVNKYLQRAGNIRLFGKEKAAETAGKSVAQSAKKTGPDLAVNIKDGNRLQADYGKFTAHVKPGEAKAQYNVSPTTNVSATSSGGEKKFMLGYNKSF